MVSLEDVRQASLLGALLLDLAINWVGWAVATAMKTEKFYDITGSFSYIAVAIGTFVLGGAGLGRRAILTGMVVLWAMRLGSFLLVRVIRDKGDARFDEAKKNPLVFFVYWTLQAIWVWVTACPAMIVNGSSHDPALCWLDFVGMAIWAAGLAVETAADVQKFIFRSKPENHKKFIETGLWRYSRHPNYFGEMVLWGGAFLVAAPALQGWQWACVGSPCFVIFLLSKVSGVPILEKAADKKWAGNEEYQRYKQSTSCVVLMPKKHVYSSELLESTSE